MQLEIMGGVPCPYLELGTMYNTEGGYLGWQGGHVAHLVRRPQVSMAASFRLAALAALARVRSTLARAQA